MTVESFGLKISLPGFDVNSATPEQCSVHSHYDSFKIAFDAPSPLEGNILVKFTDTPAVGTYPILTINTNYNYIPAFYLFFSVRDSNALLGQETGLKFEADEDGNSYFQAVITPPTITFSFTITPSSTDTFAGNAYAFRYYVFAENGI